MNSLSPTGWYLLILYAKDLIVTVSNKDLDFQRVQWKVIVLFVDINGIYCLSFFHNSFRNQDHLGRYRIFKYNITCRGHRPLEHRDKKFFFNLKEKTQIINKNETIRKTILNEFYLQKLFVCMYYFIDKIVSLA